MRGRASRGCRRGRGLGHASDRQRKRSAVVRMIWRARGAQASFPAENVDGLAESARKPAGSGRPARRTGNMESMPVIPESTKTSLAQRLRAHAKASWPQLAQVHVRFRGQFAYVAGELADGEQMPLMRLRYGGSAHRWGTAIYVASTDSYEDQIWFSGSTEEIFDLVCDLHVPNAGH
jgi:hypothetical protein